MARRPRLVLSPFVTELEWESIRPALEEWADLITCDAPGVGSEPMPEVVVLDPGLRMDEAIEGLRIWRETLAARLVEWARELGWDEYFVVADSYGIATGVAVAEARPEAVRGVALGHAALEHRYDGDRPTVSPEIWDAMGTLLRTDRRSFISYGLAQMTQGGVTEEQARRWWERFPDPDIASVVWEALGSEPEQFEARLRGLEVPLLLAQHVGCLVETEEGFEDAVAAFPEATVVRCAGACASSDEFAAALREFCESGA